MEVRGLCTTKLYSYTYSEDDVQSVLCAALVCMCVLESSHYLI